MKVQIPLLRFYILLIMCFAVSGYSQENEDIKFFHYSFDAGMIVNNSFSHFKKEDSESHSHYSDNKLSRQGNKSRYLSGCIVGFDLIWGRSKRANFITSLSISQTHAEYQSSGSDFYYTAGVNSFSYTSSGDSTVYIFTSYNIHSKLSSTYINLGFAYRFRIFKNLYIQPSSILNFNALISEGLSLRD